MTNMNGGLLLEPQINKLSLTWQGITVTAKKSVANGSFLKHFNKLFWSRKEPEFKILDNVHGMVSEGSLVAIMGTSGSGKTTLLTTISKRSNYKDEGNLLLNSKTVDKMEMINMSGFVPQRDISLTTLTAMEHAYFVSQMKLDKRIMSRYRKLMIKSIFSELGLSGQTNTLLSDLSGGERKRLSVAVQLLHDPLILFCDEPTTGLDSFSATILIEKLQNLSKSGKIIICSVHQPTSDIFSCFNQLILLSSGKLAYHGPIDQIASFFASIGLSCPSAYNLADFVIMKFALIPGCEDASLKANEELCLKFAEIFNDQILNDSHYQVSQNFPLHINLRKTTSGWFTKFLWLIWRNIMDMKRSKSGHCQQAAVFLVTSIILAVFYMDISFTTQRGIQDIHGLLYLISSEVYFTSAYRVLGTFPEEISIFLREKDLYPTTAYYLAKTVTMLPRTLIEPAVYLGIICTVQWVNGRVVISFFSLLLPLLVSACSATAYGCFLSAVFPSPDTASVISVPLDLISLLMAGMFFNIRSLPSAISWLKYFSQLHYTNEVFSVLQWQHVSSIDCPQEIHLPCLMNGTQVLDAYGYSEKNISMDLMALVAIYFILNLIGCYALYRQAKKGGTY